VRSVAAVSLVCAVPATLGGLIFWAAGGDTPLSRAIAYAFWFAAAVCIVLMLVTGRKHVWRRLPVTPYEGWVFTGAAVVLTVAGAVIDTAGAG
jgi:hypothetical protein